jgi:HK97 gp10 family phage protein
MGNFTEVKIKGLPEVAARLKELVPVVQTQVERKGMKVSLMVLQNEAQWRAPYKTGALKQSFKMRTRKTPDGVKGAVVATAPHAHLVEWGHELVGPKPNKKKAGKRTKAFKFMRGAIDTQTETALDILTSEISAVLDKKFSKAAKK